MKPLTKEQEIQVAAFKKDYEAICKKHKLRIYPIGVERCALTTANDDFEFKYGTEGEPSPWESLLSLMRL
jgi:hypothetical protein